MDLFSQQPSACPSESNHSRSFSEPNDLNNNAPQICEEQFRSIIEQNYNIRLYTIRKDHIYQLFRATLKRQEKIMALIQLKLYIRSIKQSYVQQVELLLVVPIVKEIKVSLREKAGLQFKYEVFSLVADIIRFVPKLLPLYREIVVENQLLKRVLVGMLSFDNKKINRNAVLMLYHLMKNKHKEIIQFVLEKNLIGTILGKIQTKRLQKAKGFLCQIVIVALDVYDKRQFQLQGPELTAILELIIIMCRRKRASVHVKGMILKMIPYLSMQNPLVIGNQSGIYDRLVLAVRCFPKQFIRLVATVIMHIHLSPSTVEIVISQLDLTFDNQMKIEHNLMPKIVAPLLQCQLEISESSWKELIKLTLKIFKTKPMMDEEYKFHLIKLYSKMLLYKEQFFTESEEFVQIVVRVAKLRCDSNRYVVKLLQQTVIQGMVDEVFEIYVQYLRKEKSKGEQRGCLQKLMSDLDEKALEFLKKSYWQLRELGNQK